LKSDAGIQHADGRFTRIDVLEFHFRRFPGREVRHPPISRTKIAAFDGSQSKRGGLSASRGRVDGLLRRLPEALVIANQEEREHSNQYSGNPLKNSANNYPFAVRVMHYIGMLIIGFCLGVLGLIQAWERGRWWGYFVSLGGLGCGGIGALWLLG
jgi:hypothetical protein